MRKSAFPWLELFLIAGGAGAVWYLLIRNGGNDGGASLWPALGFPYGPLGNLPGIAADRRAGNFQGVMPNGGALPATISPTHVLTDQLGNWLLDQSNNPNIPLTDQGGLIVSFPPRNATSLSSQFNFSGSRPS